MFFIFFAPNLCLIFSSQVLFTSFDNIFPYYLVFIIMFYSHKTFVLKFVDSFSLWKLFINNTFLPNSAKLCLLPLNLANLNYLPLFWSQQSHFGGKGKDCFSQKSCLEKSVCSAHVTIKKLSPFLIEGTETCFPTPLGGRAYKMLLGSKNLFAKSVCSSNLYRSDLHFVM